MFNGIILSLLAAGEPLLTLGELVDFVATSLEA